LLLALAGGVGAARFLRGLVQVHPPGDLTVVGNTGDDLVMHGLHVSPDLDSVTYTLAGLADQERGWGLAGETWSARDALGRLGEPTWFGLGDRDLATHLLRTRLLAEGWPLSRVTAELGARLGLAVRLLPMSDDPVRTHVEVDGPGGVEDLGFQQWWVGRGAADPVRAVRFDGAEAARPAPGVLEAVAAAGAIVLCPSNPVVSIAPILAVPGIAAAIAAARAAGTRVAAISPIVGGAPVRGMADKLLPAWGVEVSAAGVAGLYAGRGLVDVFVLDEVDAAQAERVAALGLEPVVTQTVMAEVSIAAALAKTTLEAL
jgi:LPPG:FO 2-phospho-L-lactate transferase